MTLFAVCADEGLSYLPSRSSGISYSTGGMNAPATTTVDSSGNIWVANSGNNTVTVLSQLGSPASG